MNEGKPNYQLAAKTVGKAFDFYRCFVKKCGVLASILQIETDQFSWSPARDHKDAVEWIAQSRPRIDDLLNQVDRDRTAIAAAYVMAGVNIEVVQICLRRCCQIAFKANCFQQDAIPRSWINWSSVAFAAYQPLNDQYSLDDLPPLALVGRQFENVALAAERLGFQHSAVFAKLSSAQLPDRESSVDGPVPPNRWRVNGSILDIPMSKASWNLAVYLLGCHDLTADYNDLSQDLSWRTSFSKQALAQRKTRANQFFKVNRISWKVELLAGNSAVLSECVRESASGN